MWSALFGAALCFAWLWHGLWEMPLVFEDNLEGLFGESFYIGQIGGFTFVAKRDGDPIFPSAGCSPNSMHVALGNIGQIIVENMADSIDIDASGCDVGGH